MKKRFVRQARQLYRALKRRGQTWTRSSETLHGWARRFETLEFWDDVSRKRIQRVLDWYCKVGIGAIYCPIACTGDSFCDRFDEIEDARENLKSQAIRYFDEVLTYKIRPTRGSERQQECKRVCQKIEQQVEFVDALKHGRKKLPKANPVAKPRAKERKQLRRLLIIDRDLLWDLLMQQPGQAEAFTDLLAEKGVFKKLARWASRRAG